MTFLRIGCIFFRQDFFILGTADCGENSTGRIDLFIQVAIFQNTLHQAQAVACVIDAETGAISQKFRITTKYPDTAGMESAGPDVTGFSIQAFFKAMFQFIGSLVCKGDGENLPGRYGPKNRKRLSIRKKRAQGLHLRFICAGREIIRIGCSTKADEILNTPNQDSGFSASSSGKDQNRPFRCQNSLPLHRVQI